MVTVPADAPKFIVPVPAAKLLKVWLAELSQEKVAPELTVIDGE